MDGLAKRPGAGPVLPDGWRALPEPAPLDNASGTRSGAPYVSVAGNAIAAGASVTVPLTYTNPGRAAIGYTNAVFIGTF